MARKKPLPVNLSLKVAILQSGETQRRFARRIGFSEIRLSEIIHCRVRITPQEKAKLARGLKQPVRALFPAVEGVEEASA